MFCVIVCGCFRHGVKRYHGCGLFLVCVLLWGIVRYCSYRFTFGGLVMAVSRETALDVLNVACGACGHWARPVVTRRDDGRPAALALSCDDGVARFVSVESVMDVSGAAKDGERVTPRVADETVQLAVFGDVRYPV